jgi:hypothetical protein
MLMHEPTPEMIKEWKAIWREHKDKLCPNKKSGDEIVKYLVSKYPLKELLDEHATKMIIDTVMSNDHITEKIPKGITPTAVAFLIENRDEGRMLYEKQEEIWNSCDIFVGIELASGYYQVEGSSFLWDELCAFQGLDKRDIENFFCVAQYVYAIEKFGRCDY